MTERMITSTEAQSLAVEAAELALRRFSAAHPLPSAVGVDEAAAMLGVSRRTVARLKLPRNAAGKIPYSAVVAALAAR